jgi:hypothetical protein
MDPITASELRRPVEQGILRRGTAFAKIRLVNAGTSQPRGGWKMICIGGSGGFSQVIGRLVRRACDSGSSIAAWPAHVFRSPVLDDAVVIGGIGKSERLEQFGPWHGWPGIV